MTRIDCNNDNFLVKDTNPCFLSKIALDEFLTSFFFHLWCRPQLEFSLLSVQENIACVRVTLSDVPRRIEN